MDIPCRHRIEISPRRSRRRNVKRAALLVAGLMLAGCGGAADDPNAELVEGLRARGQTAEQARCVIDAVGVEQAQLFADEASAEELDLSSLGVALTDCGVIE